jgi:hypothetical protein
VTALRADQPAIGRLFTSRNRIPPNHGKQYTTLVSMRQ